MTSNARIMAFNGQWDEAIENMDRYISAIGSDQGLASYRAYFLFTKGFILQSMPLGNVEENLRNAQVSYMEALRSQPGDLNILNNLVLVSKSLRDWPTAIKYSKTAFAADTLGTGEWLTVLGDMHKAHGDLNLAWTAYSDALNRNPQNRVAAQKLLGLYDEKGYWNPDRLFAKCVELNELGMAEMAVQGLTDIIISECQQNAAVAERVIFSWAGILIVNNWVGNRLERQMDRMLCDDESFRILKEVISSGWQEATEPSGWWSESDRRKFYFYALQKSWADHLLSGGAKKHAMDLNIASHNGIKYIQDFSKDIYGRKGVLEMELLIQLAQLYGDDDLEPSGENFRQLESELFQGKGDAYRSNDLESIQKFHTILAMIYVHRKKWEGGFAQNARFQLEHAISTSQTRVRRDPALYTPLPHLYRYLGVTYEALDQRDKAAEAYLNATLDYLETDNLQLSREMIAKAGENIEGSSSRVILRKRGEVQLLLNARQTIGNLNAGAFNKNDGSYFRKSREFQWLSDPGTIKSIEAAVMVRQKFKMLADLSTRAKQVGAKEENLRLQTEARSQLRELTVLSSQQDVIRIRQIGVYDRLLDYRSIPSRELRTNKDLKSDNEVILPNRKGNETRVIKTNKSGG